MLWGFHHLCAAGLPDPDSSAESRMERVMVRVMKKVRMKAIRHHIIGSRPGAMKSRRTSKCTGRKLTRIPAPMFRPDSLDWT